MGFRKQGYFLTISVISVSSSSSCDFKGAISLSVMLYMKKITALNASSAKTSSGLIIIGRKRGRMISPATLTISMESFLGSTRFNYSRNSTYILHAIIILLTRVYKYEPSGTLQQRQRNLEWERETCRKDWTRLPGHNLSLFYWSIRFLDLRAPWSWSTRCIC